ncbi:hypothetical protein GCM10010446_66780 [Streptomyces enissocaesilis]|uniref:Helicase n=1 Tax=Streptomyces enissocaesilis TaxID=332589 RepID=A0ABP6K4Y0_9ACTN
MAALYRQLRKSLEDGKNEPDAADFCYGECEMRRHDSANGDQRSRAATLSPERVEQLSAIGMRWA